MQMHLTGMALLVRDEAAVANILRENNRFNETLARIEEAAPEAERQIIQKIRAGQEEAMTVVADIANLVRDGKIAAATELQVTREDPLYRSIDELVRQVDRARTSAWSRCGPPSTPPTAARSWWSACLRRSRCSLALIGGFVISWALHPARAARPTPS